MAPDVVEAVRSLREWLGMQVSEADLRFVAQQLQRCFDAGVSEGSKSARYFRARCADYEREVADLRGALSDIDRIFARNR